ncbi:uncharacterized protein KGF55_002776 [Candida pseudojiufengensis]|uniref:uncharacterized protein n=1 Tax=Candida pseudojiufengensis TaxID=497109 RepID=UPI0022252678|nr:uncharacterized protein KGF55_002776 [Candida pseudojiufengensis]KAI5962984.1 hypothetical protein KGF55_002776 [Candida pseudojiufengensis]
MPTTGGFIFALTSGAAIRLFQTGLSGSPPKFSQKLIGYGSTMTITGLFYYYILDPAIQSNRELLVRRLGALREQRSQKNKLMEGLEEEENRLFDSNRRGRFFALFDKYSQPYK